MYAREHAEKDPDHELPRYPTGKLYERLLRDKYWAGHQTLFG